jgi:hypothetical protein
MSAAVNLTRHHLVLAPRRETAFPILESDWVRLRRRIGDLVEPSPTLESLGFALVGVAGSAALLWISLPAQGLAPWIRPTVVNVFLSCLVVATLFISVGRRSRKHKVVSVADVLTEMNVIEEGFERGLQPLWDRKPSPPPPQRATIEALVPGARIRHINFGVGKVESVFQVEGNPRLVGEFARYGRKEMILDLELVEVLEAETDSEGS